MHWDKTYLVLSNLLNKLEHVGLSQSEKLVAVAKLTIEHFLSAAWVEKHVQSERPKFMSSRLKFSDAKPFSNIEREIFIIELADLLINFQMIYGFESILREFEAGKVEGTFGVLETAKCLQFCGHTILFRPTVNKKREDYDLDVITKDGKPVCVEAKCIFKDPSTPENTIRNRLRKSLSQLPEGKNCATVIHVPEKWLNDGFFKERFSNVVNEFLRKTTRVTRVIAIFVLYDISNTGNKFEQSFFAKDIPNLRVSEENHAELLGDMSIGSAFWFSLRAVFGQTGRFHSDVDI